MEKSLHVPVMVGEVMGVMGLVPGKVVVDCTVGLGGHAGEMLRRVLPGGRVVGMDFDPGSLAVARERLMGVEKECAKAGRRGEGGRRRTRRSGDAGTRRSGEVAGAWGEGVAGGGFELVRGNFAGLPGALMGLGVETAENGGGVDGILADLGVSSPQIDDAGRGFSYRNQGPLDMRMDPERGTTAAMLVNRMGEAELAAALVELGDEEDGPMIARLIVQRRAAKPIETTQELAAVVCQARRFTMERAAGAKLHPAARTFQALRIMVNRELANLDRLLAVVPEFLKPGGVVAVIAFHSGEDRRVKKAFKEGQRAGVYEEISWEVMRAGEEEVRANPRARSAKLRWARRSHF